MHEIDTAAEVYLETFQTYAYYDKCIFDIMIKTKLEHFLTQRSN